MARRHFPSKDKYEQGRVEGGLALRRLQLRYC
jgi:hypothetical protein